MADELGKAVLTVSADTRQLEAGLQRARQQAQQTAQASEQAFTKSGRALQTAANGLQFYVDAQGRARDASGRFVTQVELQAAGLDELGEKSLAAAEGFKQLAKQLGGLEAGRRALGFIFEQLKGLDAAQAAVRTLGVDSKELTVQLQGLSQELGAGVSVIDLLKASYDVLSSGFTTSADATNILRASAQGAKGGFADLSDVVKAVTGVINAYGLSSADATKVVDGFLQTQNDGVITVREYAAEIGNIASIAAAGGVGLDQLNAAIATATLRGVPVAQTFTGLRQALASIIKPTDIAAKTAADIGLQWNVAALQAKGLSGVLADLQQKTGGNAAQVAILLGSVEAQAAIQPLLNDSLVKYNELLVRQAQSAGAAAEASSINADTVTGSIGRIQNALSNLAITLDSTLNPVFATLATNINLVLGDLTKLLNLVPKGPGTVNGALVASLLFGPGVGLEVIRGALKESGQQKPNQAQPEPAQPKPTQAPQPQSGGAVLSPAQKQFIEQSSALELEALRERLQLAQQLKQLDQVGRVALQNRLALSDKIRSVEQTRLDLQKEQQKPQGVSGTPSEQDPERIARLQAKLEAGRIEIATLRLQNQQADAAAVRTQEDRIRGQQIEARNAAARLAATQQQVRLEREALATGQQISRTQQVQVQQWQAFAAAVRERNAAQQALNAELAKPPAQQDRVVLDDLFSRLSRANEGVRQAYADAGLSLVQNARTAADALKSAKQSFNSGLQGNFNLLTSSYRQQALNAARESVSRGVSAGIIDPGRVNFNNPQSLFQAAQASEQLVNSQTQLQDAIKENAAATSALSQKDWQVYVSVPGQPTFVPLPNT